MAHSFETDAPFSVHFTHRLRITSGAFDAHNLTFARVIETASSAPPVVLFFVDRGVAQAWPALEDEIAARAREHGWRTAGGGVQQVPGGEACKNDPRILQGILKSIHDAGMDRQSYVAVIGGGAVLDAVGYAAAIAHRGLRLVRLPTTTVSQGDSGVGVKNGVNAFGKKNYLGTFSSPWAVINDERFLETLSDRDWRGGFAEAVKVGLVKDAGLFDEISQKAGRIRRRDQSIGLPVIRRSAELHLRHITEGGDPFELVSARPLDFGHWATHKLEQMTHFELRHGDAVAFGLALDTVYSEMAGLLGQAAVDAILTSLADLGFELYHESMAATDTLLAGLGEFREHLGGQLTITLLEGIGRPVDVHQIDAALMTKAIGWLSRR